MIENTKSKSLVRISVILYIFCLVGKGATSVVAKAEVRGKNKDQVAIKKIKKLFDHTSFAHRAMRELRILRCLG